VRHILFAVTALIACAFILANAHTF